mgnify:CR=1 FL=1
MLVASLTLHGALPDSIRMIPRSSKPCYGARFVSGTGARPDIMKNESGRLPEFQNAVFLFALRVAVVCTAR